MADRVTQFPAKQIDKGYDTFNHDFPPDFDLHEDSYNISSGIQHGLGPRYGITPIPGHSDQETAAAPKLGGLMKAEQSSGTSGLRYRDRIFGVVPVKVGTFDDISIKKTHYIWLTAAGLYTDGTGSYLQPVFNSTITSTYFPFEPDIGGGLAKNPTNTVTNGFYSTTMDRLPPVASVSVPMTNILYDTLSIDSDKMFLSWTSIIVPSRSQPNQWAIMSVNSSTVVPSATQPGDMVVYKSSGVTVATPFGGTFCPCNLQNFKAYARPVNVYAMSKLSDGGWLEKQYIYTTVPFGTAIYKQTWSYNANPATAVKLGNVASDYLVDPVDHVPSFTGAANFLMLLNDPALLIDNGYTMVCVAGEKPFAFFMHDWDRGATGSTISFIDLRSVRVVPHILQTLAAGGLSFYTEDTIVTPTGFSYWPPFLSTVPLSKNSVTPFVGTDMVTLGEAGTGVLRSNTIYEFCYSIYDKKLNYESNVSAPAKILTDSSDFVAVSLYRDKKTGGTSTAVFNQQTPVNFQTVVTMDFGVFADSQAQPGMNIANQLEIRFYYRAFGSYEWLPSLFIDAVQFFYYPNFQVLWACQGNAVGSVGGQPGGFNDYSELPDETYTCTVNFKGRVFWLSAQNMHYSRQNNPLAYPINNTFSITSGKFEGAIIHQFRGQSALDSQLIVFGTNEIFYGDFTGNPTIASVQISPAAIAQFPIDGSDFVMQSMTTNTSFSYRSAVVADGDLYYWGPQGVFVRKAADKPVKISWQIEPQLAEIYDPKKTDETHCVFDDMTREITWFYVSKIPDHDFATHSLVLNIDTGEYFPGKFAGKIDASQKIIIEDDDSPTVASGNRTLVFERQTTLDLPQRAYFFDHKNKCGDIYPTQEMMVKTVSTPVAGQRTFTLATGFDASGLASLVVGDLVGVPFAIDYAVDMTAAEPFVGEVISANSGAGTVTISIPDSVAFDAAASLTEEQYFPIYCEPIHSFPYNIETKYWTPGGLRMFWYFLYLYGLYKLDPLLPTTKLDSEGNQDNEISLRYKTIFNVMPNTPEVAQGFYEATLKMKDNSDANYQVYKALVQSHAFSQGIKFSISGNHFAGSWVLQYLELLAQDQTDDQIKTFEE